MRERRRKERNLNPDPTQVLNQREGGREEWRKVERDGKRDRECMRERERGREGERERGRGRGRERERERERAQVLNDLLSNYHRALLDVMYMKASIPPPYYTHTNTHTHTALFS